MPINNRTTIVKFLSGSINEQNPSYRDMQADTTAQHDFIQNHELWSNICSGR